jgi:hypothetical protein
MNPIAMMADGILKNCLKAEQWEQYSQIMWAKYDLALKTWAFLKLGKEREKYYELAYELFLTNLAVSGILNARTSDELLALVNHVQFLIPPSVKTKLHFPLADYDPHLMHGDYEIAMLRISEAKRKAKRERLPRFPIERGARIGTRRRLLIESIRTKNRTNYAMAIAEMLPGYPIPRIKKAVTDDWKPSMIAMDYVAWKYKFPLGIESLKKQLAQMKYPGKVAQKIKLDVNRALKASLSIAQ